VEVNFGNGCTPMYRARLNKLHADVHACTFCCSCQWRFYRLPFNLVFLPFIPALIGGPSGGKFCERMYTDVPRPPE
jgi:hypothetical protein